MKVLYRKIKDDCKIIVAKITATSDILLKKIEKYLKVNEIDNYKKFKNERRKAEWLGVRILLKELLGTYSEIKYKETGNPYIENELSISVTHSKNIVGIILSKNKDIGIDVEILSSKINRTAHKFITDDEISSFNETDKLKKIYLNWCCKETLFKIKEHGGFNFKEHFTILDSDIKESGMKKATVKFNNKIEHYDLLYKFIEYQDTELLIVWH